MIFIRKKEERVTNREGAKGAKEEKRREEEEFKMLGLFKVEFYPFTAPAVKP
jgi:hypothetical protein